MKWYCVIALCIFSVAPARCTSSESEALQQAFVLVDLLKAEYARLNKQNSFLRAGVPLSTPEQPTCPTTQRPANNDHSFTLDGGSLAVPFRRILLNNLTPDSANNMRKQSRLKSRRLEYDDMFGPHPGEEPTERTSQTQPTSTLPTSSSASPTPPPTKVEITIPTVSEVAQHLSTRPSIDFEQTRKAKIEGNKAVKLKLSHQKPTSRDPVIEQVASEVMNEMKDRTTSKFKVEIAPLLTAKTERYTRFENVKGTYRIHQATSKRYPIPLPENNAFCFYHPDNPLCRTFI
ncbi:uncharacterized protein LOC123718739 [Pieris brassicae]|uniref:uncharacterized protein LOC123718739 n=1 Tax=Pieris brassicae TaxID=7116 RepID=UPI001E662619|nr:uncharacterized protein LOC123718739 [Pieris brassicae]